MFQDYATVYVCHEFFMEVLLMFHLSGNKWYFNMLYLYRTDYIVTIAVSFESFNLLILFRHFNLLFWSLA
jgi:hypothetical protein